MANPMTAVQSIDLLKKWNIEHKEYKDWSNHNRNSKGNWGPVHGLMVHHTGSDAADQRQLLYSGYSTLPGPLCHWGLDRKGVIHNIGWGRANHAGGGDGNVLQKVIAEDYTGILKPKFGNSDGVDGNARFYGVEIWYSGSHEMTDDQYYTLMRLSAAICTYHKWSSLSVIGHGEWSNDKWDPGISNGKIMNMAVVRGDIQRLIKMGPEIVTDKKPQVYKDVWEADYAEPPTGRETNSNPTWAPVNIIRAAAEDARSAKIGVEELIRLLKEKGVI